jgi:hypothetical protein
MKALIRSLAAVLVAFAFVLAPAAARAQQSEWDNVARVVVIGDLEGDYEKFVDQLRTAGLIDARNNWAGGAAHLVQLGDIPDRGPNSRMIMDLLRRLEPQARRAGGYVHALIGNHEAMNVEGDLRYVHPGEYAAFADRNSARRRETFYRQTLDYVREHPPASGLPVFDDAYRAQWESEHPLGWVEHRQAWAASGTYGRWVAGHDSIIRINDTLYMHGGLGPTYLQAERGAMNDAVRGALRGRPLPPYADILTNQDGPLWYRGLALNEEAAERAHLEALLARHRVSRIVVGHTKLAPAVVPRFEGRVIVADIARSPADPHAFLIIENGAVTAVHRGQRVPVVASTPATRCAYFNRIAALDPAGGPMAAYAAAQCSGATSQPAEAMETTP